MYIQYIIFLIFFVQYILVNYSLFRKSFFHIQMIFPILSDNFTVLIGHHLFKSKIQTIFIYSFYFYLISPLVIVVFLFWLHMQSVAILFVFFEFIVFINVVFLLICLLVIGKGIVERTLSVIGRRIWIGLLAKS